jgi:crossover junction endodeoxyribonuclease RuvC
MIVIGVDPGTLHLGWGVLQGEGNRVTHLAHGVIDVPAKLGLPDRLVRLERGLMATLDLYRPTAASVESLFFYKDAKAAAKLGHARGVVLVSLARARIAVHEYEPARVKNTIAGHGRADKGQMVRVVRTLLSLDQDPREDAADALALALTYLRRAPLERVLAERAARGPRLTR